VQFNLQHVVNEISRNVDCPEGATFSERRLGKSTDGYQINVGILMQQYGGKIEENEYAKTIKRKKNPYRR